MEVFIGTVCAFGFNYQPMYFKYCSGQLLQINQYTALFALLGTNYGGNGTNNFGLPNLQGRVANCMGQQGGGTNYQVGNSGGSNTVTLLFNNLPAHTHQIGVALNCNNTAGSVANPVGAVPANSGTPVYNAANSNLPLAAPTVSLAGTGGTSPITITDPYLVMNYCIATEGIFPPRN